MMNSCPDSERIVPVSPEEVLQQLMHDGIFDSLKGKVLTALKQNEQLKSYAARLVSKSDTLQAPEARARARRELFESLRKELEAPILEYASRFAWEALLSPTGIGGDVYREAEAVYNRLVEDKLRSKGGKQASAIGRQVDQALLAVPTIGNGFVPARDDDLQGMVVAADDGTGSQLAASEAQQQQSGEGGATGDLQGAPASGVGGRVALQEAASSEQGGEHRQREKRRSASAGLRGPPEAKAREEQQHAAVQRVVTALEREQAARPKMDAPPYSVTPSVWDLGIRGTQAEAVLQGRSLAQAADDNRRKEEADGPSAIHLLLNRSGEEPSGKVRSKGAASLERQSRERNVGHESEPSGTHGLRRKPEETMSTSTDARKMRLLSPPLQSDNARHGDADGFKIPHSVVPGKR